jgi:hypothetical protein
LKFDVPNEKEYRYQEPVGPLADDGDALKVGGRAHRELQTTHRSAALSYLTATGSPSLFVWHPPKLAPEGIDRFRAEDDGAAC